MKRWIYLSLLLVCLILVFPATAQENAWYAYFYNTQTATLNYVNAEGSQQSFSLGVENPGMVNQYNIAFAHSRPELAYCITNEQGNSRLVFRDLPNQRNRRELELGVGEICRAGYYNSSDLLLSVGILRHSATSPDDVPSWEILLVDTTLGLIVDSLSSTDSAAAIVTPYEGAQANYFFVPDVFWMDDETVLFEAMPIEGRGLAYAFNRSSHTVSAYTHFGNSYQRFGSEALWITFLEDYPYAPFMGVGNPNNAVTVLDSAGAERVIYYSDEWNIGQAIFINGGQQIAIYLTTYLVPDNPTSFVEKWIVLDREGHESDLLTNIHYGDGNVNHALTVYPAFTGHSILETISDSDTNEHIYRLSLVENGVQTQIWEQITDTNTDWSLLYMPEAPYQAFGDFPAVDMSSIPTVQ